MTEPQCQLQPQPATKTLFLDFDGVLHPLNKQSDRLFVRVVHFERVMRQFPTWQIVISSAWREGSTLETLRQHFSPDIAQRIVGVTPSFFRMDHIPDAIRNYEREVECRAWLQEHGCQDTPWLAVDDWDWLFAPKSPNVFIVDSTTGLDRKHARELTLTLARIEQAQA